MTFQKPDSRRLKMPLSLADAIFNWANILLVLAGTLTVVATVLVVWTTGIRDRYANERITANEALNRKGESRSRSGAKTDCKY